MAARPKKRPAHRKRVVKAPARKRPAKPRYVVPSDRARKADLVRMLNCDRKTLVKYLKMVGAPVPDFHRTYEIQAVRSWVENHATSAPRGTLTELKIEQAKIELEESRDKLARSRGEYISKEEAAQTIIPLMGELGALLRQKFVLELPSKYKGRDVIECSQMNEGALDEVIKRFKQGARPITSVPKPQEPELFPAAIA